MTSSTTDTLLSLLEKKVKEAKEEMSQELNKQLFGSPPPQPDSELKRIIRAAVEEHMPNTHTTGTNATTYTPMFQAYLSSSTTALKQNIFDGSPLRTHLKEMEKEMSNEATIAAEAVRKRKEAKAEETVEYIGDFLESSDWVDGDTVDWTVEFPESDKVYHYVALKGGARWYITGDGAKYSTDDLIGKITELALRGKVTFGPETMIL
jgi:hypothetical protein